MVEDQHIARWLAEGLINAQQAQRMLSDVAAHRKERASDRIVAVMSTVGAILLGVGAILFVASNWQVLSNAVKTLMLIVSTFGVSYLGYLLAYGRQTLPRVGAALLFLGTLLFGATLFLVAQMYHVQANSDGLVLLWLVAILPLAYLLRSVPVAALSAVLLFVWIGLAVFHGAHVTSGDWWAMPVLYLVSGLLLFEVGGSHDLAPHLRPVARTFRIAGLQVSLFSLFLLSFKMFSGHYDGWHPRADIALSTHMTTGITIVAVLACLLAVGNLLMNPTRSSTWKLEGGVSLGLLGLVLLFFFFPSQTNLYALLFNLALAGCIALLIALGYYREDMKLVNMGTSYLTLLVVVRYCDLFWRLLPRSIFFMVGGAILVLGGIALERKRREWKARFTKGAAA